VWILLSLGVAVGVAIGVISLIAIMAVMRRYVQRTTSSERFEMYLDGLLTFLFVYKEIGEIIYQLYNHISNLIFVIIIIII